MAINNVIFDLGNVLLKWDPQTVIDNTFDGSEYEGKFHTGLFAEERWQAFDRGDVTENEIKQDLNAILGIEPEWADTLLENVKNSLVSLPESVQLLEALYEEGLSLYCLSNMPREFYTRLQEMHNFWHHFDHITISGHVNLIKPDKAIYKYVIETNDLVPQESIFIDDLAENVEAARSCGLHGIQFIDIVDCKNQLHQIRSKN